MNKYCEIHKCNYEAQEFKAFGNIFYSKCPLCEKMEKPEPEINISECLNKEKWIKSRIRPEFFPANLKNFHAETPSQAEALQACQDLISGKIKKVVLMGSNGIGKSHLGNSVLKVLGGKRYTAYELSCLFRQCYSAKAEYSELQLIEKLVKEPFFLIEELGRSKGSEAEMNFLSQLIDELHTNKVPFMIITNKIKTANCKLFQQDHNACTNCQLRWCIEKFLDNDILSRLSQDSKIITVTGRDYRRKE